MTEKPLKVDRFEEALAHYGFKITWNCAACKCKEMTMSIRTECDKCHTKTVEIFPVAPEVKPSPKDQKEIDHLNKLLKQQLGKTELPKEREPVFAKDIIQEAIKRSLDKSFEKAITDPNCLHHCKGAYCMNYHSSGVQCPLCSKCSKFFQGPCSEEKPNA